MDTSFVITVLLSLTASSELAELKAAVDLWVEQARVSWIEKRDWPDRASDRAAGEVKLSEANVIRGLSGRVHEDITADGWVKRRLLARQPKLDALSPPELGRIVGAMPAVLPPPQPSRNAMRQMPGAPNPSYIGTEYDYTVAVPIAGTNEFREARVTESAGVGLGAPPAVAPDLRTMVEAENKRIAHLREFVNRANRPGLTYRDELISLLPEARGVRLAAMVQNVRDRASVGDPSTDRAITQLVEQAERQWNDPSVPPDARRALEAQLREIQRIRTVVTNSLSIDRRGAVRPHQSVVGLRASEMNRIINALRGREPRP